MSRHVVSIYLTQKMSISKDYLSYCVLGPIPGLQIQPQTRQTVFLLQLEHSLNGELDVTAEELTED